MNRITYHSQVPFKGYEEFRMVEGLIGLHVLWEEERLFQSLSHHARMPPAIMPKGGIIRDWHTIYLTGDQVRVGHRTWATGGSSRLSTELDLLFLWS